MLSNINRPSLLVTSLIAGAIAALCLLIAQADTLIPRYRLTPVFPSHAQAVASFDASIIAGLLLDSSQDQPNIIIPVSTGSLVGIDGKTGSVLWRLDIPRAKNQKIELAATPVIVDNKMIVSYQVVEKGVRISHRMAVVDLVERRWDDNFQTLELHAQQKTADGKATVKFNPPTAYSHAALKYAASPNSRLGFVYAGFGNASDTQPFHGWLFEIDLDAWFHQENNKVISGVLLTTPEPQCPVNLEYGTQEMICGGGIWAPAGPKIIQSDSGYELLVPTGNGQVDLARDDYANSLLKIKPGLHFEPDCNEQLCRNFNPSLPDEACLSSCKNLFIPRLPENAAPLRPANQECDDKTFAECLAWMDYDLGGSAPAKARLADGKSVLIQPGKDGAVYLIDADHLGTQFDRLQITGLCGTENDPCKAGWMGMIVTQPIVVNLGETPMVIIPTFVPDRSHPGGVVALTIVTKNGRPKFEQRWRFPERQSSEALTAFRSHPSFPVISRLKHSSEVVVWIVDTGNPGTLYGISVKSGKVLVEQKLQGTGRQLSMPVIRNDMIYLASTSAATGKTFVEAYRISQ
ncbi:MAG: hypothetical protein IPN42_07045 [Methylococcaceae bacterium]|nr:hypothetical protein [Methylococcaceae bacterium]